MFCRGTDIARIGAIMFEAGHAGLLEEGLYFPEILIPPIATEARRTPERHAAPLPCLRINHINLIANPTAGQQGITPHLDSFAFRIIHQSLKLGDIFFRDILCIRPGTEAQDNHLVPRFRTLVYGSAHNVRFT